MKSVLYFFAFFSLNAGILRADWSVSGVVVAEDKKRSKHRECSHTPEKRPAPPCWAASVSACWGSPQTPVRKEGKHMEKRTREIVLRVPVTPEERALIQQRLSSTRRTFRLTPGRCSLTAILSTWTPATSGRRPQSCKRSGSTSTRLQGVSTVPGLCTRRTWRTSRGR